jgi:1-deoxy-D-xylulose-5-phosphate synthase
MVATIQEKTRTIDSIESPSELRRLSLGELEQVCDELREFLIYCASQNGGHFASGLGALELTVALHYVFSTPEDRLVWDVGHQTYPHKALTGRREGLLTVRRRGGPSGFPRRSESPYDTFGVAHAGTAISAALGMAIAAELDHSDRRVVAVVGDGALTAGMALEGLNHAGYLKRDLLVVVNDNGMSISPNVGAVSRYLRHAVDHWKRERSPKKASRLRPLILTGRRTWASQRGLRDESVLNTPFEEFGFEYSGPVDGHNVRELVARLTALRDQPGPRMLHVVTRKGKGYHLAEADPIAYHGVSPFDLNEGITPPAPNSAKPGYTAVFGKWLCDMGAYDKRLVAVTPAMREGSGLSGFARRYPQRFFDAAIAEQHAVTLAAGLSTENRHPVLAIYSTFLQRAYDSLIHDVAIQNLPVLLAIDRAGVVGPDGPTHAGSFDLTYLRCIPNLVVMAPADEQECRQMLTTGYRYPGPAAVRYPKGKGPGVDAGDGLGALPIGCAETRRRGSDTAILSFGSLLEPALEAAERLDATVINMRFVKPLDEQMLLQVAEEHRILITVEDNVVSGGAGSAVNERLASHQILRPTLNLGLLDRFLEHGTRDELLAECGLSADGIFEAIRCFCARWRKTATDATRARSYRSSYGSH